MSGFVPGNFRKTIWVPFLPLLAIAVAIAPHRPRAEAFTFSGKVVDSSGAAIPWALIRLDGGELVGQSGLDGTFNLAGNAAAIFPYPDPEPSLPFAPPSPASVAAPGLPDRYLLTGRLASGPRRAAALLLAAPTGVARAGKSFPGSDAPLKRPPASAQAAASAPERPPAPPRLHKTAAHTLTISMAHFQEGTFPQGVAGAKGLVLTMAGSATDTARYAAEKKLCLDTINAYRAKVGLGPLAWSRSLEAFADQGARYDSERDAAHGHFSAFSKGAVPSDAENAVPGWPLKSYRTVAAVVAEGAKMMWAEGPGGGHYENIKGRHSQVGCGIYVTSAGDVWVLHDFK